MYHALCAAHHKTRLKTLGLLWCWTAEQGSAGNQAGITQRALSAPTEGREKEDICFRSRAVQDLTLHYPEKQQQAMKAGSNLETDTKALTFTLGLCCFKNKHRKLCICLKTPHLYTKHYHKSWSDCCLLASVPRQEWRDLALSRHTS